MENNNFKNIEGSKLESTPLFNEMHDEVINRIGSTRALGNIFGNFFHYFSGFIILFLGGKPKDHDHIK